MERTRQLRLVYIGNLGLAHDVPLLCDFIGACAEKAAVEVCFIGTAERSLGSIRQFARGNEGVTVVLHPYVSFEKLPVLLPPMGFDYGIITLSEEFLGLLSPSKFAGYLAASLPVIYLGPAGTNAAAVCDEMGAGIRLDRKKLHGGERLRVMDLIFDGQTLSEMQNKTAQALQYFKRYDGDYLAGEILGRVNSSET